MERKPIEKPDLRERGGLKDGQPQFSDRRLFMQLLAFGGCTDSASLARALEQAAIEAVLYEDINDPQGVGLLVFHEDPNFFVTTLRALLNQPPFVSLVQKHEYTMMGRTYAMGYEPDLEGWLIHKPRRTALNRDWPWAVWYPLRRSGAFVQLDADNQRKILMEHGVIGRAFGESDYAHDIRLVSHGLDKNDNDFVIGLMGSELFPLSAIVQAMRKTTQTSQYLENLGPFFIGKAVWQSPMP